MKKIEIMELFIRGIKKYLILSQIILIMSEKEENNDVMSDDYELLFSEGDVLPVENFEKLKEIMRDIWVKPNNTISNWSENEGLSSIKVIDIKNKDDDIFNNNDVIVEEKYNNGESEDMIFHASDINYFIRKGCIKSTN